MVSSNTTAGIERFIVFLFTVLAVSACTSRPEPANPDYIEITSAGPAPAQPATGSYMWSCGHNEEHHLNTANIVMTPGIAGPVHHVHDYIGNLSTDIHSTDARLAAAETTCVNGDKSTYFWPVLRDSPHGSILAPASVMLTFSGNPRGPVVAMPRFLRGTMGDARAVTQPSGLDRPTWTCSSTPGRRTNRYPLCPVGDQVLRIFDFPSCWDGRRTDSLSHRTHLDFPAADGTCPAETFAVPRLRITLRYDRPAGSRYVIDGFPDQRNSPITDHAFFINLMPESLMARIVRQLNTA